MGVPATFIRAPFCIRSLKGSFPFLRGEDFSGFFPEPFLGAITAAAVIITAIITATATLLIITITTTAISGTLIRVKAFPVKEIFEKVSVSTFL